jgi:hypothetical protein
VTQTSAPASTTIRPATPADLPAIGALLGMRDGTPWDPASVAWFTMDLDPDRCLCWLAWVEERPVGLTMMYVRTLRGPSGTERAGYWANLYIDPAFRDRMLYPRLPMAMFQALPAHRLAFLYTSVRLPDLATAHTRIGFAKLGAMSVLAKPLRPARLIGKYRHVALVQRIAPPIDALYRAWLSATRPRVPPGVVVECLEPSRAVIAELVQRIDATPTDRIAAEWTVASMSHRYRQTTLRGGGSGYQVAVVRRDGRLAGGLSHRLTERGDGIRAGVVMDVIGAPVEGGWMAAALADLERRALDGGADVLLFLSGLGPEIAAGFARAGFRPTHEAYELMIWPKQALQSRPALQDLGNWSFALRDHDAF